MLVIPERGSGFIYLLLLATSLEKAGSQQKKKYFLNPVHWIMFSHDLRPLVAMTDQSFLSSFPKWFSPEQCSSWAVQLQEPERSVQWLVKSLVPVWDILWQEKHLFVQTDPDIQAEQVTEQLLQIWAQNPAISPALVAFSGIRSTSIQHLAPDIAHILGQWIAAEIAVQSLEQYQMHRKSQRPELDILTPQQIRAVLPELYTVPVVSKRENARQDLRAWLGGWLILLAMALLFFYWLQRP